MSIGSFFCNKPIPKIIAHITNATIPKVFPNEFNLSCNGVVCSSVWFIISAIFPTSVVIPVSTTIPFPRPYVIKLDENSILVLSPIPISASSIFSIFFSTGTDSPVNDASWTFKFAASIILKSAGT